MLLENLKQVFSNSSVKLVFLYSTIYISSSLVLLSFIFWFSFVYIQKQVDHHIEFDRKTLTSLYKQFGQDNLVKSIRERFMHEDYDSIYLLYDGEQNILGGNLSKIPENLVMGWNEISLDSCMCVKTEHSNTAKIINKKLDDNLYFINGLDVNTTASQKKLIIFIMSLGLIIIIILGTTGGIIVSRNAIRKINLMNATILDIKNGNFNSRITHKNSNTDYDLLAKNINNMLDQIEILVADIQNMSNHISHDLRTPLTRMRGNLELVLATASEQQTDNVLAAIDEADTLLSAFNAILRISKVESGTAKVNFRQTYLNQLINDVSDFYEPLADDRCIKIVTEIEEQLSVNGDRDMLFQALANLVDNAIKYSPENSEILVKVFTQGEQIILHIADSGKGIPDDEVDNVFKRFFQLSKHRGSQGHGLGLSLVGAIIKLHNAKIDLKNNKPGLLVELVFSR